MTKTTHNSQETPRHATQTTDGLPDVAKAENLTMDALKRIKSAMKQPDPIIVYAPEQEFAALVELLGTTGEPIRLYGSDTSLRLFGIEIRKADLNARIPEASK